MRRGLVIGGAALGVVANLLQVASWLWGGSRSWINAHGLWISVLSVAVLAILVSLLLRKAPAGTPSIAPTQTQTVRLVYAGALAVTGKLTVDFRVHHGPIEQLSDVDIVVSSENTYMQMSQMFKPSTSGRLRYAAATKDSLGHVSNDVLQDELIAWMNLHGGYGRQILAGQVIPTPSGELIKRGVRRIYHAAAVQPEDGSGVYHSNANIVASAVKNVFAMAKEELPEVTSICFPLLGAGRGGLSSRESMAMIYETLVEEVQATNPPKKWVIHFISWRSSDLDTIIEFLATESVRSSLVASPGAN